MGLLIRIIDLCYLFIIKARFLESEAGNRAESDICYEMTLRLMGSSQGEIEPRKATYP